MNLEKKKKTGEREENGGESATSPSGNGRLEIIVQLFARSLGVQSREFGCKMECRDILPCTGQLSALVAFNVRAREMIFFRCEGKGNSRQPT